MMELPISFFGTAFVYCTAAVAILWILQRLGWLRDGALAEVAWRSALWLGILVATVSALRAPLSDLWWSASLSQSSASVSSSTVTSTTTDAPAPAYDASKRSMRNVEPEEMAVTSAPIVPPITTISKDSAQWLASALGVALTIAIALLLRSIWLKQRWLWHLRRRSRPVHASWIAHRDHLSALSQEVSMLSVAGLDSPIAAHSRLILLPDWCDALDADAQRALLAHELAHIQRGDPLWRLCDAIAVALLAGFPFARYAQSRLHDLSEFACDAEAAQRTGSPRALAECLAHCLEYSVLKPPALAVAMVTPASGVVARVHKLLEEPPMFRTHSLHVSPRWAIVAIAVVALILPGVAFTIASDHGVRTSVSITSSDGLFGHDSVSASFSDDQRKLKIEIEGKVQFNDAETDVLSISEGGSLKIVDINGGIKRELGLESQKEGFARHYRVDGDEVVYDAAAQRWFALVLPEIFRRTGFDADARLKRILARGGVEAVLAEIELIQGDYARSSYIGGLIANAELGAAQFDRVVDLVAAIDSDYELRRALTPALSTDKLSQETQIKVLALAAKMESDYERAELLIAASQKIALNGGLLASWQAAVEDIDSDYEKRRVLEALLDQRALYPEHAALAIAMAGTVDSDYEKRMLLEAAAKQSPQAAVTRSEYVRVARTIDSDYERRQALMLLLEQGPVNKELALDVIQAAAEIGSDYEVKELLLELARFMPADREVIDAYRSVARGLSPYERGEVEAGLDRFAQR